MNSIETGGSKTDQPATSDKPGGIDSSPVVEDASNREARGLLDVGGHQMSGNISPKQIEMLDRLQKEQEKWEKKLGAALK